MPACQTCDWNVDQSCTAYEAAKRELNRELLPAPTGSCIVAIVDDYLKHIQPGMRVLEIGCGTWSKTRDHCLKVGASFEGIDVQKEYYGVPCIATRYENLAKLSFSDEEFDIVIGNQTLEHWGEHGCTPEWGLHQCFRVLKRNGNLFLNVPLYFHGTKDFVHARLPKLKTLFARFSDDVSFEKWGYPSAPFAPYFAHPKFNVLKDKPVHILDIRAKKNRITLPPTRNWLGFSGKLAQIFHYSFSYNLYRLRIKLFGP